MDVDGSLRDCDGQEVDEKQIDRYVYMCVLL